MVKVTQINLHHSKAASAALLLRIANNGVELITIQEPWVAHGKILGLNMPGYKLLYAAKTGNIRACILAKNNLNIFILSKYSDEDTVAAAVESGDKVVWVLSCYMAHDHGANPPNDKTRRLVEEANRLKIPVVMCADANAHHHIWGSTDTNDRGECLFDFLLSTNMLVVNRGSEPTFVTTNRSEVLDITAISASSSDLIEGWSVSKDCSFSDHAYIDFSILEIIVKGLSFINRRKTNWEIQKSLVSTYLGNVPDICCTKDIDIAVNWISSAFSVATNRSCKPKNVNSKTKPPWWNEQLVSMRLNCRKLFNKAKSTGNWSLYKAALNSFKNQVRNAKRKSWREFCSNIENSSETNRLRKILAKTPSAPSFIQKTDSSWTTSSLESLELLMTTHFPGCVDCSGSDFGNNAFLHSSPSSVKLDQSIIKWAISSFKPYKAAGPDGIIPADLQHNMDKVIPWLHKIYAACLTWSYIPKQWTRCNVIFIPKCGKASHTKAKDYRPISLTSFLLKTFERILDNHIRLSINPEHISASQHAYTKGRSVDTALHSIVGTIEKSLTSKNFTLVAFLDIEGAFNNVKSGPILDSLRELGIDDTLIDLIRDLLSRRLISSTLGEATISKIACRGTPQGGVISPLLWNIALNSLLVKLDNEGFKTIAYADDVAIAVTGNHLNTISDRLENGLKSISRWSIDNGLSVNPTKTELVLFTGKYKIPRFRLPKLNGTVLSLSDSAKYLGVILDKKLSWSANITSRVEKATTALYVCRNAIGKSWGINPSNVNWIYKAVVKPTLLYGASVWWTALDKARNRQIMERVLRTSAILITGALRTTPTKALFSLLFWLPIDLLAKEVAGHTALRLSAAGNWKENNKGHSSILKNFKPLPVLIDYCIPKPFAGINFEYIIDANSPATHTPDPSTIHVYTDGSKQGLRVGGGIFIEEFGTKLRFRLQNECSVLQAEITAVLRAANWLRYYRIYDKNIHILTDSQATIKSLIGRSSTSNLVQECRASLNVMAKHSKITLIWVKGHGDSLGNCLADSLAKEGANMPDNDIDTLSGILLSICKDRISNQLIDAAQARWTNEHSCQAAKIIWPTLDRPRTYRLLMFSRADLRNLVAIITGHCIIGNHARRLGLAYNDFCRSCQDVDEEESISHLICSCPALTDIRLRTLGYSYLEDLSDLVGIELHKLNNFIRESKWFPNLLNI